MAVQFFGQFLLAERLLSPEQLVAAVTFRQGQVRKLQAWLVSKGYLERSDLARVAVLQATRGTPRFLDAAVELGLITEAQAEEAAREVGFSHVYLGEAAVALGFLSQPALDQALERFHATQREPDESRGDIPSELPLRELCVAAAQLAQNLLARVWGVPAKPRPAEVFMPGRRERFSGHVVAFPLPPDATFVIAVPDEVAREGLEHMTLVGAPAQSPEELVTQLGEILVQRALGIAGTPRPADGARAIDDGMLGGTVVVLPTATSHGEVAVAIAARPDPDDYSASR